MAHKDLGSSHFPPIFLQADWKYTYLPLFLLAFPFLSVSLLLSPCPTHVQLDFLPHSLFLQKKTSQIVKLGNSEDLAGISFPPHFLPATPMVLPSPVSFCISQPSTKLPFISAPPSSTILSIYCIYTFPFSTIGNQSDWHHFSLFYFILTMTIR